MNSSLLRVTEVRSVAQAPSALEFDEFVPLQFRSFREPLGAGYLRLGNYSSTLIELAVEPHTQMLRGVTVTSIDTLSPWPSFSVMAVHQGLPVLATDFADWKVLDLEQTFSVSAREGEIVVFWGALGECDVCAFDRVRFLVCGGMLAGVWFVGLTAGETQRFRSHAPPAGPGAMEVATPQP